MSSHGREGYGALGKGLSYLICFMKALSSWFSHLPKAPPTNTITWDIRISTYEFGSCGDINIQNIETSKEKPTPLPSSSSSKPSIQPVWFKFPTSCQPLWLEGGYTGWTGLSRLFPCYWGWDPSPLKSNGPMVEEQGPPRHLRYCV